MNRVIHFDLYAKDPERAMKFYKEIFSWEFKKWEDESIEKYWMIKIGSDDKQSKWLAEQLLWRPPKWKIWAPWLHSEIPKATLSG